MNKFLTGIIVVLVAIIFLQRSCSRPATPPPTGDKGATTKVDTVWITKDSLIIKRVPLVKKDTQYLPGDIVFVPDTNYERLRVQFETLAKNYAARNIYHDTILLDTLGHVVVHDTVQYNELKQRSYLLNYKLPVITKTVTPKPRRQVYIGGGISMNTSLEDPNLQVGLLYKNRKDQIFGVYTLLDGKTAPQMGVSSYWKISLKK